MKKSEIPVVILKTKTGYSAHSPFVNGCIATGKTIDRTLAAFKSAVQFHLEGERLVNFKRKNPAKALRKSFDSYGTDAIYATVIVAA